MAITKEALRTREGVVLRFPEHVDSHRRRRRRMLARRRCAAAVGAGLLAFGAFVWATLPDVPVASRPDAPRVVEAEAGGTLWDLAERYAAPGTDPRVYVTALLELNEGIDVVAPGALVRLPAGAGESGGGP